MISELYNASNFYTAKIKGCEAYVIDPLDQSILFSSRGSHTRIHDCFRHVDFEALRLDPYKGFVRIRCAKNCLLFIKVFKQQYCLAVQLKELPKKDTEKQVLQILNSYSSNTQPSIAAELSI